MTDNELDDDGHVVLLVRGTVQGVGFRDAAHRELHRLGLRGEATNQPDGTVRVTARGQVAALRHLNAWLVGPDAPGKVLGVETLEVG
ncbi:acylphosphatase [Cellulomonas sp. PhB143]|uniref:acylphosphatase n=1 Tax=Cellulomonas sp. PhB143 TaxID=2485186 RepID=UPI000F49546C|nr:acylphosphatase [Cellulomonas sp. PhB143]ROS76522.1 acylphosphatase [Cellulomonas sp. PhB143]